MQRLQKKCLYVSASLHLVLLVVLIVGPAFLVRHEVPIDMPLLEVIPSRLIDDPLSGGGNPNATPPPPPAETPKPQPQPVPKPKPPPPKPQPKPDPTPTPPQTKTPAPEEPKPKRAPVKVNRTVVQRDGSTPEPARIEPRQTATDVQSLVQSSVAKVRRNLSTSTTIEMPGAGGPAYANYAQAVKSIYDRNWYDPAGVTADDAVVRVEVTVARDGRVLADPILRRSGILSVDQSVQEALNRVRALGLPPFPAGATDERRVFIINFSLQSRRV